MNVRLALDGRELGTGILHDKSRARDLLVLIEELLIGHDDGRIVHRREDGGIRGLGRVHLALGKWSHQFLDEWSLPLFLGVR